jgi:hypothetical protein
MTQAETETEKVVLALFVRPSLVADCSEVSLI